MMNRDKCTFRCTKHPARIGLVASSGAVIQPSAPQGGQEGKKCVAVVFPYMCYQGVWTEMALGLSMSFSLFY